MKIVDDATAIKTGVWREWSDPKFYGNTSLSESRHGGYTCSWVFEDLEAGEYDVAIIYWPYADRPVNAPFAIFDGDAFIATVLVDQTKAPSGLEANSWVWLPIGKWNIASGILKVKLTSVAGKVTVADAVRISKIGEIVPDGDPVVPDSNPTPVPNPGSMIVPVAGTYEASLLPDGRIQLILTGD